MALRRLRLLRLGDLVMAWRMTRLPRHAEEDIYGPSRVHGKSGVENGIWVLFFLQAGLSASIVWRIVFCIFTTGVGIWGRCSELCKC
jgi:hypothetical protein